MSDNDTFISKFCTIPINYGPEIVAATEEEVINHFKNYIEETCAKQQITLVKYVMPDEFKARVSKATFFDWIYMFLCYEMKFEDYDPGTGRMDEVCDSTFEDPERMGFKEFYMVHIKPYNDELYFQYAVNYNDLSLIDKVVFRIYNPDVEP